MAKICMISTNHLPFDSRIFHKEAKSLSKAGYEVKVVTRAKSTFKEEVDNIKVVGIGQKVEMKSYMSLLRRLLKEALVFDADVYHFHEPESLFISMYLKLFKNKKVVYDVHEYYWDIIPSMSLQRKLFFTSLLYFFEPLFCRYFDAIITADDGIAQRYKKFNSNVHPIFNFPSLDVFNICNYKKSETKYGDDVIVYVGGMSEERGVFNLVKAIHKVTNNCPSVKLLLVGNFESTNFKNKCSEYIHSNNLEENVDILGFVPHNEIPKYIDAAKIGTVLLYPTIRFNKTPYPIKLFEYMICGKAVLASNLPAMGSIIKKSGCGVVVNPLDIDEIADKIMLLLDSPNELKKMGENGKNAVKEKYNWEVMGDRLIEIYRRILK